MTFGRESKRILFAIAIAGAFIGLPVAHNGAHAQSSQPRWAYSAGTITGVPAVDSAVAAIVHGDAAALRSQFVGTPVPCTGNQGIGAIPCPSGQPAGTGVIVFRSGDCESTFLSVSDPLLDQLATRVVSQNKYLFAVARTSGNPAGSEYAAFFGGAQDSGAADLQGIDDAGITLDINSSGIIGLNTGCRDGVGHRFALRGYTSFVLPPKLNPAPPNTGSSAGTTNRGQNELVGVGWLLAVGGLLCLCAMAASRRDRWD